MTFSDTALLIANHKISLMNLQKKTKSKNLGYLIPASHDKKRNVFCMQNCSISENCHQIVTGNIKSSFCSVLYLFTKPLMDVYNQQPFLKSSENAIQ